jgi:hypothetical protein
VPPLKPRRQHSAKNLCDLRSFSSLLYASDMRTGAEADTFLAPPKKDAGVDENSVNTV